MRVLGRREVLGSFAPPRYDDYDIRPDGRKIVHVRPHTESDREVVLVLNAFAEPGPKTPHIPR